MSHVQGCGAVQILDGSDSRSSPGKLFGSGSGSEQNVPAAPSPAPAPGKMYRLRRLRLTGCEVVQIWDGSSSGSVKKTYPGSASGSEHNFRAAPAPNKMCRLQLRIVAYVTWPVADNSYK